MLNTPWLLDLPEAEGCFFCLSGLADCAAMLSLVRILSILLSVSLGLLIVNPSSLHPQLIFAIQT